jgi:hypothetical protein
LDSLQIPKHLSYIFAKLVAAEIMTDERWTLITILIF